MRSVRLAATACAVAVFIPLLPATAQAAGPAAPPRPAQAFAQRTSGAVGDTSSARSPAGVPVSDRLIVKFRKTAPAAARRSARASASAAFLRSLPSTGAEVLRVDEAADVRQAAARLARDPNVVYATPDVLRRPATSDPWYGQQWGLSNTGQAVAGQTGVSGIDSNAAAAWATQLGAPDTTVAVIDTGVDISHPDLAGAIWTNPGEAGTLATNGVDDDGNGRVDDVHGWDFANDDASVFDVGDGDQHGTHVAGTIAAAANNNIGGAGVAYGVKIMPLKFLGPNGGWDSHAITAIGYAKARGVKVINASWGSTGGSPALKDAIASCECAFVAAAGNSAHDNDNSTGAGYPASFDLPNIISVAAMDNTGALASFSNYGATTVDVAAPGVSILSTVPRLRAGVAAVHVSTGAYTAQHWGFGLEDIATATKRADLLGRALSSLGTAATDPVLLVADDEGDTITGQSSFYTDALGTLGFTNVTRTAVLTDQDGPSAADMAGKTVIWETGLSYGPDAGAFGPLTPADHTSLTTFLDGGGKLLLAGADAIYLSETTALVRDRLQITFLREGESQTALSGLAAPYVGHDYTASSADSYWGQRGRTNPYRDVVELRGPNAVAVLQYPGEATYDNAYAYYHGTSMAAPHAAGVAALVQTRWPSLSGAALADRVKVTARPTSSLTGKVVTGGFVDAAQAIGTAPSPPPTVSVRAVTGNLWVSWPASVAPFGDVAATGYEVQLVRNGVAVDGWTAFAAPGEYAVRNVPGGGTYTARVRAVGSSSTVQPRQSTMTATMTPGTVPGQVGGVSVAYAPGATVLSWTPPATNGSGILAYDVCQTGGSCRTLSGSPGAPPASTLTWEVSPAEVSVRAVNSYGNGAVSPAAQVQPPAQVPPAVVPDEPLVPVAPSSDAADNNAGGGGVVSGTALARPAAASRVPYGRAVAHRTTLLRSGTSTVLTGQPVQLLHRRPGTARWTRACSITTSTTGSASCLTRPSRHMQYRWQVVGTTTQASATTSTYIVRVDAKVTATVDDSTVRRGALVRISGSVAPRHARQKVYLQRYHNGSWHTVTSASLSRTSAYAFAIRGGARGTFRYRVLKRADADHGAGTSATRQIRVR